VLHPGGVLRPIARPKTLGMEAGRYIPIAAIRLKQLHMCEDPVTSDRPRKRKSNTALWLRVMGTASLILFVLAGLARLLGPASDGDGLSTTVYVHIAEFAVYIAAGLACGGGLVGLSALLRHLKELQTAFGRLERFQYEMKEAADDADADHPTSTSLTTAREDEEREEPQADRPGRQDMVLEILMDIRDNSLLSVEERREKQIRVADEDFHEAGAEIRPLIEDGEFAKARQITEAILRKYPRDDRASELTAQVERAREQQESNDVVSCERQVDDLISISAWGRARELAQQLQLGHPDSVEARQLLLRIERHHRLFEEEQRRRMNAEVQRLVTRRRWEEALAAARTFIERFPGCEESEAVRMQVPTLEANAEIEERQRLEARIMEYVRHGRYIEAVSLARQVIEQFPDSPQAEALRAQLERLEELAENPDAPPARIRVE